MEAPISMKTLNEGGVPQIACRDGHTMRSSFFRLAAHHITLYVVQ